MEIVTGADGRVIQASVAKSKDHPDLDLATAQFARGNWSGPPHHRTTVPVDFRLH